MLNDIALKLIYFKRSSRYLLISCTILPPVLSPLVTIRLFSISQNPFLKTHCHWSTVVLQRWITSYWTAKWISSIIRWALSLELHSPLGQQRVPTRVLHTAHAGLIHQPHLTLWPMDCSPPGASVHGLSQARTWSGLPCPPPGGLPDPGVEPWPPALAGGFLPFIKKIIYSLSPGKPMLYSRVSLVTYFIHSIDNIIYQNIYMSVLISQFILPPRFSSWYPYVCCLLLCLYFSSINKTIYTNFFRFHIYALIYDACFSLVLRDRRGVGNNLICCGMILLYNTKKMSTIKTDYVFGYCKQQNSKWLGKF